MKTDSFKQRQLLFQGGSNQANAPPPKPRASAPLINKEMFEPKSKNSSTNINNNKNNNNQETNSTQKKSNVNNPNPILKLANQMENKIKNLNEDRRKSLHTDEKIDLNISKENLSKKVINKLDSKKENEKKIDKKESEIKQKKEKENENKPERKESDFKLKKEIGKKSEKIERKESDINEIKKDDKRDAKKEKKIDENKKQVEKGKNLNEENKKLKEIESKTSKKEEKITENKKDSKINEITKKFEKEKDKDKKGEKKSGTELKMGGDTSFRKESYNIDNKINLNKDKETNINNNNSIKNNLFLNNFKKSSSPSINPIKNKEFKGSLINLNQEKKSDKNNKSLNVYDELYSDLKDDKIDNINKNINGKSLSDLEIDNFKDFNEEDYLDRKYDKNTIDKGKIFFKYRYLKNKYTQINETIIRLSNVNNINNFKSDNRISAMNTTKLNFNSSNNNINNISRNTINIDNKFKLSNNIHLSFFINNPSSQCLNSIDKDSELRHYHSQFLQITEKSILCFNLKKYEESFLYLSSNNIIKNLEEYGEFLLVVNGFDKFVIGEFLSNIIPPNDKKEVLKHFIKSIKMNYEEISFLECFRFFMKRLYLPKDANLILEIMNAFSEIYFAANKKNKDFLNIFQSPSNIYLLISTLLAVNTMFTRKDIKNINVIKKEEFVSMNKDIQEAILINIYEELEKKPLLIDTEDYNENIYKRMSTLVKEKISAKNDDSFLISKTFNLSTASDFSRLDDKLNNVITEEDSDEEYDSNLQIDTSEKKGGSNFGGGRPFTRSSFSLTKNLYSFTKQDQDILSKTQKFYKLVGNGMLHEREFLVYDNFTKLIWGKSVEENKVKGNLHCLLITDIFDVFNGIEHSENIKKYIKSNPKEAKEKNNFITIISNRKQINLKSDSLQTSLLWYKALKSLVLKTKNENMKKNSKALNEQNTQFKLQLEELWKDFILPKWNIYGNYILMKLKKKNKIKINKEEDSPKKNIDSIIKDVESDKNLEYSEFFDFFYLGLPSFCRGTIWKLLIGNSCFITETLYENYLAQVEPQNFNDFDIKYHEDINTIFNREYNINQMITDVIKGKDIFLSELINLKIDQEKIMNETYSILRVFFLIRNDLVYKKSIVPLIYVFLMVDENEYNAFCNVYNLICNSDIIKLYIGDEDYINKNIIFFRDLVKKYLPKIHEHFTNLEIDHELYFIPWISEIFSSSMSFKLLLRVLDLYLLNGEYILFQIGLSILSVQEDDLLDLAISEIFKLLKRLSSKYKEDFFLEKMKSFDGVKDEYNKWKNENELGTQKLQLFQAIFNDDK